MERGYVRGLSQAEDHPPLKAAREKYWVRCALCALGTVACYALGTGWFMAQSGRGLAESLGLCVLPFLPGDAAKILLAAFLSPRLRKALDAAGR